MLRNDGLDVVAKEAQKVSDNTHNMLLQWLQLDVGMIDENDGGEVCDSSRNMSWLQYCHHWRQS